MGINVSFIAGLLISLAFALHGFVGVYLWRSGIEGSLLLTMSASWFLLLSAIAIISRHTKKQISASQLAELEAKQDIENAKKAANRDPLTGLYSRAYLKERLDEVLINAARRNTTCAVLYLDLDNFKDFNEALGHDLGNKLLASVSLRLKSAVKQSDLVGYFGGDEFIIVLPVINDVMSAEIVARRILSEVGEPFEIQSQTFSVSTSIGIAIGPGDGSRTDTLISHAESAVKERKQKGRKGYSFYSQRLNEYASNRLSIDQRLRGALQRGEFSLVYQPIITDQGTKLKGFEVLLRWHSPELGNVSPTDFIPVVEQIGLISEIGNWVLRESCAQMQLWQSKYGKRLVMSVNVSPRQFHEGTVIPTIKNIIKLTGIQARSLQLEMTEGLLLNSTEDVNRDITLLHDMGVKLALDDFGTGYSSLSYISDMPFDVIKVDKSFVDGLCVNRRDHNMVTSIISIAHNLDMEVVIEGVETAAQIHELIELKADSIQGFYYSKPVSAKEAEARFLARDDFIRHGESVWENL